MNKETQVTADSEFSDAAHPASGAHGERVEKQKVKATKTIQRRKLEIKKKNVSGAT